MLRHGSRRHHRRRRRHTLGTGGQHRAWSDRAVTSTGRRAGGWNRLRRPVPAFGRPRDRPASTPRRTDRDMRFRRRSSTLPRAPWPSGLERTEPLRGQLWTRSEQALREPDVRWGWKGLAVVVAGLEIGLLVWLWFGPALAVRTVQVAGARHMTSGQVAHAAGLQGSGSVISLDGASA